MSETAAAVLADRSDEPDQLQLRFFAVVGGMQSTAPERALWRELLDLAIGKAKTLIAPDGRAVSAATVWAVGAAVYFRANARGVVEGFSYDVLAADCRIAARTTRSALKLLAFLRIVTFKAGSERRQRGRRPRALHMNLGGLDWPAVRRRAKRARTEQAELPSDRITGHHDHKFDDELPVTMTTNSGGITGHHDHKFDRITGHHDHKHVRAVPERADPEELDLDPDLGSERAGRQRTAREPARRPDEPASEQQVAMLMTLQRKQRLPSQHVSEEEARTWTRIEMSEALSELENLEERRGRTPTREELLRLEEVQRYQRRYGR